MASKPASIRPGHRTARAAWPLAALLLVLGMFLTLLAVERASRDPWKIDASSTGLDEAADIDADPAAGLAADPTGEEAESAHDHAAAGDSDADDVPAPGAASMDEAAAEGRPDVETLLREKFDGSEIIARVGPEVILASEVLPDANRNLESVLKRTPQPPPAAAIGRARMKFMSVYLESHIETKLAVVDARQKLPKGAWEKIEWAFNVRFAKEVLPKMMADEGCDSLSELEAKLGETGTSIEALRRQAFEGSFARAWIDEKGKDPRDITQQDLQDFYEAHRADYEAPARARWKHLSVRFESVDADKEEARLVMAGIHQQAKAGFELGKVAEARRKDVLIDDKADSWIDQGALASDLLDTALFTLPIGGLSDVLEDDRGLHILRVVERQEAKVTPLADAAVEIRQKIEQERNRERRAAYKAELRKTIPVWNIFEAAGGEFEGEPMETPVTPPAGDAEAPATD